MRHFPAAFGLAFLSLSLIACGGGLRRPTSPDANNTPAATSGPTPGPTAATPAADVSTAEMEWVENSVAAKAKYGDRPFNIKGRVRQVSDQNEGRAMMVVEIEQAKKVGFTQPYFSCFFNDAAGLAAVKQGDRVTVRGTYDGRTNDGIGFGLADCKLVK